MLCIHMQENALLMKNIKAKVKIAQKTHVENMKGITRILLKNGQFLTYAQILQMKLRMDLPQEQEDPVFQDALILVDTVWVGVSTVAKFVLLGAVPPVHTE